MPLHPVSGSLVTGFFLFFFLLVFTRLLDLNCESLGVLLARSRKNLLSLTLDGPVSLLLFGGCMCFHFLNLTTLGQELLHLLVKFPLLLLWRLLDFAGLVGSIDPAVFWHILPVLSLLCLVNPCWLGTVFRIRPRPAISVC